MDTSKSEELRYPPVRVDQSIEKLDLNSLIMRSNARPHAQEATALDESTYEVVGMSDSVYETSDDEGHTASVASTTPDDASTFDDDEEDDDFAQYTDDRPLPLETSTIEESPDHDAPTAIDDSALTEAPYMRHSESRSDIWMVPEGEHNTDQSNTKVWAVTKEFTSAQTAEGVLKPYQCSDMRLAVRADISASYMPARSAFKILYVGNISDWARVDVESCISKALCQSPGPSRSIMRQGQMEPYGPVLSSDLCTDLKRLDASDKSCAVKVTFDDGMEISFGNSSRYSTKQQARLPDLVVFWYPHPRLAAPEIEHYPAACKALSYHKIPCLHVAEDRRFHHHSDNSVCVKNSIQLCVEGRNGDSEDFVLKENLPIDMYTLQNLDSSQLNRHIATLQSPSTSPKATSQSSSWSPGNYHTYFTKVIRSVHSSPLKFGLAVGLLSIMLSCYYLALPALSLMQNESSLVHVQVVPSLCRSGVGSFQTAASPILTSTSSVPPNAATSAPGSLSVVLPLQKLPSRRTGKKKVEKSFYDIHMTGGHQFTLSPDKELANRKSKPQLQIQVMKDAEKIPIRYTRTIDGGYVVELEQEYQVGLFNVSISTHSKPYKMQQWFTVSLGRNKTVVGQFVDFVNRDVAATQENLRKMSSVLSGRAKSALSRAGNNIDAWKKQVRLPEADLAGNVRETQKEVQRQLSSGIHVLQEVTAETWMGIRKVTAPLRTSDATLRARANAFRIRCRFEEAVGLSGIKPDGGKSRACKQAGR
ncbi:unnamed protein product [Periconia digitata]|uniref:Uncharacterized protein n=1 Tax=Periconia digitata TaxID=1303443 RepID=A0A9W4XPL8_9PLEO|nr:unnamed protein product [Periconia digitata]